MTTLAPERGHSVAPEGIVGPPDDGLDHLSCHCVDDLVADCGLSLHGVEIIPDTVRDDEVVLCPLCAIVAEMYPHTCRWGCACDDECAPLDIDSTTPQGENS